MWLTGVLLPYSPSNVKVGSLVLPASTAAALGMPQDASAAAPASQGSPSLPPPSQNAHALAEKKKQLEAERQRLLALKVSGKGCFCVWCSLCVSSTSYTLLPAGETAYCSLLNFH